MKTTLHPRSLNSSRQFWNARTSVGHTKEKAAGMKRMMSQGLEGSGSEVGLMEGEM